MYSLLFFLLLLLLLQFSLISVCTSSYLVVSPVGAAAGWSADQARVPCRRGGVGAAPRHGVRRHPPAQRPAAPREGGDNPVAGRRRWVHSSSPRRARLGCTPLSVRSQVVMATGPALNSLTCVCATVRWDEEIQLANGCRKCISGGARFEEEADVICLFKIFLLLHVKGTVCNN